MFRAFAAYFKTLIKHGRLSVEWPGGSVEFGDGTGPDLALRIADRTALVRLLTNPALAFGELYMDGRIEVARGELFDVVALASRSMLESGSMDWMRLLDGLHRLTDRIRLPNGLTRSRHNASHHYDLDARFYRLLLDEDLQYSCAYFEKPSLSLGEAQLAKKRHIAAKLLIEPGQRVLDIGCGWGGLGLYLVRNTGATVEGVTLSSEQCALARDRARDAGLADHARFAIEDYRQTAGSFDRIVSVGMLEHVGRKEYRTYFKRIAELLSADGVALVHTIGRALGPAATNKWLLKYVFPGGYIPALSELSPAIEEAGLFITDVEILRLHYAETIGAWRRTFAARRNDVRALYDERFCRMWDLYLCGAECAFRIEKEVVFQIQLAKKVDTVPLTRGYMAESEEALRRIDGPARDMRAAE